MFEVQERDVPEQVVLTEQRNLFVQELPNFDGVAHWVALQGLTIAASPREVYFADFRAAAPEDEVCDVAFPLG